MCQFFSCLVLRNGDVLWHEATDSHRLLFEWFGIPETTNCEHAIRVECVPGYDPGDVASYTFGVDETSTPIWWEEIAETAKRKVRAIVASMIVRDERKLLLGGKWILVDGAKVGEANGAQIVSLRGNSRVGLLSGFSSVGDLRDNSRVDILSCKSSVGMLLDNSRIGTLRDKSRVGDLRDNSSVGTLRDNSRVDDLRDKSRVGDLRDYSSVGTACDYSRIGTLCDNSRIGTLCDNSRVDDLHDYSSVDVDNRTKAPQEQ
jgi:hypothetical protein